MILFAEKWNGILEIVTDIDTFGRRRRFLAQQRVVGLDDKNHTRTFIAGDHAI